MLSRIVRLPEDVVNRIAAGEVVQRPSAALKELLENSLDAGATSITIKLRDGGLQLLQVSDNGSGIDVEDLPLVAERFATSKLRAFSDLAALATFGFRGEAVASLSYVALVSVVSRTAANENGGYRCSYRDGRMVEPVPSGCACPQGTTLSVENMFYNYPTRRDAFAKSHDEHGRMIDVVQRYAIDNPTVCFTLGKADSPAADLNITRTDDAKTKIAQIFRQDLGKHLVSVEGAHSAAGMTFRGYISGPFFTSKRTVNVLFVNRRLVECPSIRRSCEQAFARALPKNAHPFVYLSLSVRPDFLDVNVHPTKQEVRFLCEEDIVGEVHRAVCVALAEAVRQHDVAARLQRAPIDFTPHQPTQSQLAPQHLVRADPQRNQMERFVVRRPAPGPDPEEVVAPSVPVAAVSEVIASAPAPVLCVPAMLEDDDNDTGGPNAAFTAFQQRRLQMKVTKKVEEASPVKEKKRRRPIPESGLLTSVRDSIAATRASASTALRTVVASCMYVGVVDAQWALFQHGTALYLADMCRITEALATQLVFAHWARHERGLLTPPVSISDKAVGECLARHAPMLQVYFGVIVSADGAHLETIPLLIPGHVPAAAHIAPFLKDLAAAVETPTEAECFQRVAMALGRLTRFPHAGPDIAHVVERSVMPLMRQVFHPPPSLMDEPSAVQCIATTEALYKVFERC